MSLPISTHRISRHSTNIQSQSQRPQLLADLSKTTKDGLRRELSKFMEKGDECRQANSVSEEWMLRVDAVYTELEDELIQFKNGQTLRMQSIIQRQQTSEQLAHFRVAQLLAKTNCIASKIKTTLAAERHSRNREGQNLKCTPKFSECWLQSMSGDIAARISLAMVGDQ